MEEERHSSTKGPRAIDSPVTCCSALEPRKLRPSRADLKTEVWTLPTPLPPWLAWSERWWYWVREHESWRYHCLQDS